MITDLKENHVMIGKIRKDRSFAGCIRYVIQKDDAEIIAFESVLVGTAEEMAYSFRWQCLLNPDMVKLVGHIVLSCKPENTPRLTDAFMARLDRGILGTDGDTKHVVHCSETLWNG